MEAAAQAHVAEHLGFLYRSKLEEQLGVPLPKPDEEETMPEEIELQLSRLVADASKLLLQQNQAEMAQKQALEQAQDPMVQMRQAELAIKQSEVQRKAAKDATDAEIKGAELGLEAARIKSQEKQAALKVLADAVENDEELKVKQLVEAAKVGIDISGFLGSAVSDVEE